MQGFLIWEASTVGLAAFCVWRSQPARILLGLRPMRADALQE
jgi:hypothetical protein